MECGLGGGNIHERANDIRLLSLFPFFRRAKSTGALDVDPVSKHKIHSFEVEGPIIISTSTPLEMKDRGMTYEQWTEFNRGAARRGDPQRIGFRPSGACLGVPLPTFPVRVVVMASGPRTGLRIRRERVHCKP